MSKNGLSQPKFIYPHEFLLVVCNSIRKIDYVRKRLTADKEVPEEGVRPQAEVGCE